ncbi:MAG: thioredoxin [Parcubacteria group bacterium CG08_land_8_20_14_0_20_48_21]|nr:MAG: thioredoxin [Parcubacteria group bacterium CG2_30_48_51]PIS33164.1 MAG: thioredoxin [Parcubacteria group bacterium CG08_land_8_20_14_0_20_48_21]PIW79407.1 MAG: thioredoxin [Parcubacteria group bacterium CG_4_8_14_3_um_filter_48_16]PIY77667.1 MAG: thioredoxin [Parcubacteria group bacterium CG_4_10_14_0_8_um_filter_48_154]PIZ77443.1 MAG: thioredoxin [bacterium CG_4_10_14_0_2_um_filter_48_144]PJC40044.1 MAG: thioredoxin [Parcubacteria group bacterium CG_4_9_14_0_2_um_filter_48_40]PJE5297
MSEITLTDQNFASEVLQSKEPILVDFWAPWCGPCRILGPVIEEIAQETQNKGIKVGKLNVDENPNIAGNYNVMSIPTTMVFKGGKPVEQFVGVQPKQVLVKALEKAK